MRKSPIKRHARRDPVTPELRAAVLERDGGCVGHQLGAWTPCSGPIQLDHVREQPMMGKRAPSDLRHLVAMCLWHHTGDGWATSHRPELRAYLEGVNA